MTTQRMQPAFLDLDGNGLSKHAWRPGGCSWLSWNSIVMVYRGLHDDPADAAGFLGP